MRVKAVDADLLAATWREERMFFCFVAFVAKLRASFFPAKQHLACKIVLAREFEYFFTTQATGFQRTDL